MASIRAPASLARVHLRAIKLRGFKSFPDPVEVRLEPGVAVVVGPNGSGKSNIADAIIWAAGSSRRASCARRSPTTCSSPARPARRRPTTARSSCSSTTRTALGRLEFSRGLDRPPPAPRRRGAVPGQRRGTCAGSTSSSCSPTSGSAAGCTRSSGRAGSRRPRVDARGAARAGRGGRRARALQAPAPPRRAEARAGREPGRARARRRGGGHEAAAAARAAGDSGRARGETRLRNRLGCGPGLRSSTSQRWAAGWPRARSVLRRRASRGRHVNERLEALLAERNAVEEELTDAAGRREESTAALYRLRSAGSG